MELNLGGGGDAPAVSTSNKSNKRPRKTRGRGWISPKFAPRSARQIGLARSLTYVKQSDVSEVRPAWVPAPAKSTGSVAGSDAASVSGISHQSHVTSEGPIIPDSSSTSSNSSPNQSLNNRMASSASASTIGRARPSSSRSLFANTTSSQTQLKERRHQARRPPSKVKSNSPRGRRTAGYTTLQSKDSLVDVTACLQEKRKEVMKLWQHHLISDDPTILGKIEIVNKLALEAAEEVEFLRKIIQTLQKKPDGLSDEDCTHLNDLRAKVLTKVKEFEEADKALQGTIITKSLSKTLIASATSHTELQGSTAHEEASQAPIPEEKLLSNHSLKDVVFLKGKSDNYSDEDEKSDVEEEEPVVSGARRQFTSDTSTAEVAIPTAENLNHLKLLYQENLKFPPIPEGTRLSRSHSYNVGLNTVQAHEPRKIRFASPKTSQSEGEDQTENVTSTSTEELYRGKISHLQRKLMNTEQEVEELKSDIERIESDANFRVRMLQNSVQDQFETLKGIPDHFQMVEAKLTESNQVKMQMRRDLHEKDKLLQEEKEQTKSLRKEVDELKEKLRVAENLKEFQAFKSEELEKSNQQLRREVEEAGKQTTQLVNQIKKLKDSPRSPRTSSTETQRMKLKCSELKEDLAQAKRIILTLKKSKAKLYCDSNQRIEELLQALQTAQHHKRILGDQIRLLKKSYNEMYPCNCKSHTILPQKPKSHKTKRKPESEHEPVDEPQIEAKEAWRTGEGITIDNQLDLPLNYLSLKH